MNSKNYGGKFQSSNLYKMSGQDRGRQTGRRHQARQNLTRVLLIEANSSQALQELHFQQATILKRLQAELPEQKITRLNLRAPPFLAGCQSFLSPIFCLMVSTKNGL